MPSNIVTDDRVLICVISHDYDIPISALIADLREFVQGLDHEVLYFSNQKKSLLRKIFLK